MQELTDYSLSSDLDIKGMQIGFVMNHLGNDIGIFIPKLMCDIEQANVAREKSVFLNSNMIKNQNKIEFSNEIKECNYIICKPLNVRGSLTNLAPIGSQIFLEFLDGDPKKAYYLPFRF